MTCLDIVRRMLPPSMLRAHLIEDGNVLKVCEANGGEPSIR